MGDRNTPTGKRWGTARSAAARIAGWLGSFRHLSLLAVLPITAHAHWHLAVQLGVPPWLAPLLPVAIDSYVLASFRAWRDQANRGGDRVKTPDLLWALMLDAVAVAGSHAAGQYDLERMQDVRAGLAATLGVLLVLTLWRVHALDVRVTAPAKRPTRPRVVAQPEPVQASRPVDPPVVTHEEKPQVSARQPMVSHDATERVLAAVRGGQPMTKGQIVAASGLSRSTAGRAVDSLVASGSLTTIGDPRRPSYVLAQSEVAR